MIGAFRRDINGLRAYAVLAVLLFHFGVNAIPGGFVGVDVFFVLSGFLMTQIILTGQEQGRFSLGRFYLSRARRIVPALAVLCFATLVFGWFWLAPSDYVRLGKHALGAISFTSNFTFKDEAGYFDAPSQAKWLLHSWSLSVEWQFYLLYPLLLVGLRRVGVCRSRALSMWLGGGALVSLALCVLLSPRDNALAFYMLPTRAWEMLLGALVYLCGAHPMGHTRARVLELLGMLMVLAAATTFHADLAWPGAYALVPALGAALVLIAARSHSLWMDSLLVQALGRWSYSIYLWHWPLVVGLNYMALSKAPGAVPLAMGGSVLLGWLSYRWVEQPMRQAMTSLSARTATLVVLGAILGIGALGIAIKVTKGIPARVSAAVMATDREAENHFPLPPGCGFDRKTGKLTPCIIGDGPVRWVVLGDSHAGTLLGAVHAALPGRIHYYTHQCATIFDSELKSKNASNRCPDFMREVEAQIAELPSNVVVIIINRYSVNTRGPNEGLSKPWGIRYLAPEPGEEAMDADARYRHHLAGSLCRLAKGHSVVAVRPIPEMGMDIPRTLVRAQMTGKPLAEITLPRSEYEARNATAFAALADAHAQCGIALLDPAPYLCDQQQCYGAKDGKSRYFDDDHLSESGNRLLIPLLRTLKH